ncbi:uncharacterized protein FFFS_16003 [Fusarium fujikuroi]|jgi:hypothetical protein
MELT